MAEDKKTNQQVIALVRATEKYYTDWRGLIWRSFVAGIFTALGATAGFAVVFWLLGIVLERLGVIPVVGDFFIRLNELIHLYSSPVA